jgi:hypothetical protein
MADDVVGLAIVTLKFFGVHPRVLVLLELLYIDFP